MKLIEIDPNNLPECEVLCISDDRYVRIGHLVLENDIVYCTGQNTTICDVTHYLPLTDIKPESNRVQTYLLWVSYISNHFGRTAYSHREATLTRVNNNPIHDQIKDFLLSTRNAFAAENSMPVSAVVQLSFSCTETT